MGSITLASPFQSLAEQVVGSNPSWPNFGSVLANYRYTGESTDFAIASTGIETASATWETPADAVAAEYWINSQSASDKLYFALASGVLSTSGSDLTTRAAFNDLNSVWITGGQKLVVPFFVAGTRALLRFAGNGAALRVQGRYLSEASGFPYRRPAGVAPTQFNLVGAGAGVQQIPYNNTAFFPAGYSGCILRVGGTGPVRWSLGSPQNPTATVGDFLSPGVYLIDEARHGIALSAIRFYIPVGTSIIGWSINNA